MKCYKLILFLLCFSLFLSYHASGQANAYINILSLNGGQVNVGSFVDIQVSVGATVGTGGQTGPIPVNKVRAQISIPPIAVALPNAQQTGLPPGWIILTNSGAVIQVCNGTDVIPVGQQRQIFIKIQGVSVGGPSTIGGNLSFGPGAGTCTGFGSLPGDNPADNTSQTTIQVLAAVPCNLAVTASAGSIACNGSTTTLTATSTGANGAVEYSITGGTSFQAGNTFTVGAGTYTVTAREISTPTCIATSTPVTITQPAAISASAAAGSITCNQPTTTLTVTASGGVAPLQYSLNGGAFQSANTFTVGAGTYTATVKDANNCTVTAAAITVSQPGGITATSSAGTIICNGGTTTLTVTASGGLAPLQYSLDGVVFQSGNTFTVMAGTYTATVKDANNCTVTAQVLTVNQPIAITVSSSAGTIVCNGGTTTLTVTATGGIAPLQYILNGGTPQSGNTFIVVAGTYTATVKDANNCTGTAAPITITQPAVFTATAAAGTIACFGGNTTLTVTASGGAAPLQYSVNNGAFQSGNTFTIAAGTYTATVKDANNCTATTSAINVTQPTQLTASATSTAVTVPGGSDGTATAIVSGGTPPYTYSWNTIPVQTTVTAVGLPAGTYTVTVTDFRGCTATATTTVNAPACNIIASASAGNIACNGGNTTLTVTATGGSAPYQYSIDGINFQSGNVFTVIAGTYTATVKDITNCTAISAPVTISQPTAITASASAGTIACNGGTTILTVTAGGGTAPLQYSLNSGPFQTANTFTVGAGTHTATVRDANNCIRTAAPITVTQPVAISASSSAGLINCNGGTTTLTVSQTGGTAPFQYSLNGGTFQTGNTFTVAAGTYTVVVRDANNCTGSAPVITVTQPTALTATATATAVTTIGGADGTATAIPSGGTAPYSYAWNTIPVQTTVTATGLTAGTYTVTVTDFRNCTTTATATVTSPVCNISASASAGTIACNGGTTTLTASSTGGIAPVQYRINGGAFQTGNTFTVSAGTYTVTARGANFCTATTVITVGQPLVISATASAGTVACNGGTTALTTTATGGTAPYQYSLNGGTYQTGNTFTVSAGTNTVTVKDANNCTGTASAVTLSQPATLKATATANRITECGGKTMVTVTATGGTAPYQFPGGGTYERGPGTWTFSVTDARGCTASTQMTIEAPGCVELEVYPNPSRNVININHSIAESGAVMQVFDAKSTLVISQAVTINAFLTTIDVRKLSAGTYFIIFINGKDRKAMKFIKG